MRSAESCKEGIRHEAQGAYREYTGAIAEGVAAMQVACMGRDRLKAVGPQGTRGAVQSSEFFSALTHIEHVAHVVVLGRVEAERLVERRRGLPSRKAGM